MIKEDIMKSNEIREVLKALESDLSPVAVGDYSPNKMARMLRERGLIKCTADMNRLALEMIQQIIRDGDEIPVHYYNKNEDMPEGSRVINDVPCLTDDYIATYMSGE